MKKVVWLALMACAGLLFTACGKDDCDDCDPKVPTTTVQVDFNFEQSNDLHEVADVCLHWHDLNGETHVDTLPAEVSDTYSMEAKEGMTPAFYLTFSVKDGYVPTPGVEYTFDYTWKFIVTVQTEGETPLVYNTESGINHYEGVYAETLSDFFETLNDPADAEGAQIKNVDGKWYVYEYTEEIKPLFGLQDSYSFR